MKKLLQINVTSNWGSTGKIAEQIGQCAISRNWESYIAYGRMSNPSKSMLVKVGTILDVYEHYAENLFLDNEGLASRRATKQFLKRIDEISPDIIHLHNIHDHYLNYRILFQYLSKKQIPVVWTQHDQWATTGHCMYAPLDCSQWKEECYKCPLSKWFSLDRSHRNFCLKKSLITGLKSLTVVPVSNWLAENISKSYLSNQPIRVIHNGIDINTFSPQQSLIYQKLGILTSKKVILGVAALWDARKGLDDFIKLSKILPSHEYAIVIVGKLQNDVKHIDTGCQVVFVERTQDVRELAQLYSGADVFINPTYQDNYPTTNLEALACGTPVITYRTGGSPEAVDEKTGVVIETGNVQALAEAIVRLKSHPLLREDCRARAEEHFDNAKCFDKYFQLYESIME